MAGTGFQQMEHHELSAVPTSIEMAKGTCCASPDKIFLIHFKSLLSVLEQ